MVALGLGSCGGTGVNLPEFRCNEKSVILETSVLRILFPLSGRRNISIITGMKAVLFSLEDNM